MPVGKGAVGAGFMDLLHFLGIHQRREWDRVAWTASRNLPDSSAPRAAKIMEMTAARREEVMAPVYHLLIDWAAEEDPYRYEMEITVDRVLWDLGLAEHQALLVAHQDHSRPHVHLVVNRVHPETLQLWEHQGSANRINRTLRYVERQLGWLPGFLDDHPGYVWP
jgi:hypothetical protein